MPFDQSTATPVDNSPQFDESTAQLVNNDNSSQENTMTGGEIENVLNQPKPQQQSPLNFGDMLKLSALGNDNEGKQNYLSKKFQIVQPSQDGKTFLVGNNPQNLTPIDSGNIGDKALMAISSVASAIPSIGGQMYGAEGGAALGTAVGGPVGTVIGGLLGAAGGAAAGEAVKNAAVGMNAQKAAADNLAAGVFGAAGEGLGQVVNVGMKNIVAPKVAQALDAMAVNPNSNALLAKALNFISNVDTKEVMAAPKWGGFEQIFKNKSNFNPDTIDDIAQEVTKKFEQQTGIVKTAIDKAEASLLNSNPHATVDAHDILSNVVAQLKKSSIVDSLEGDGDQVSSRFFFKDNIPSSLKSQDIRSFLKSLGAREDSGGTFSIPTDNKIPLSDAINAKKIWGGTLNDRNFDPNVSRIFKSALYGEGSSPLYPQGFTGLRTYINDLADATGNGAYNVANKNFSSLMNAGEGSIVSNGSKINIPWMDIKDPTSVAKYLSSINKKDAFGNQAINNLKSQIGGDWDVKAGQYGVAQAISKAHPQLLRLGIISSLMGAALPGDATSRAERIPAAFLLGSPTGVKLMASTYEKSGQLPQIGNAIINGIIKNASTSQGKAILSQLIRKQSLNQ